MYAVKFKLPVVWPNFFHPGFHNPDGLPVWDQIVQNCICNSSCWMECCGKFPLNFWSCGVTCWWSCVALAHFTEFQWQLLCIVVGPRLADSSVRPGICSEWDRRRGRRSAYNSASLRRRVRSCCLNDAFARFVCFCLLPLLPINNTECFGNTQL